MSRSYYWLVCRRSSLALAVTTLVGGFSSPLVFAQDIERQVEEVVVTASRIAVPKRQVATSVAVVSQQEIEAHGNLALVDVLRQMPSVATSNNGGPGKTTTLRIRGEEGFRTLAIFDGIRLMDPSASQVAPQFDQLLSSGISRVEILRGPQGLAYGADAGGVVNISSRQVQQGFYANLDAQVGAFDTRQVSGSIGSGNEFADFFLTAADYTTDSFNSRPSDNVLQDDDGYKNTSIHGRGGINLSDQLRLNLVHRQVEGDNEHDGCYDTVTFTTVHDCTDDYEMQASRLALDYSGDSFSHALSYNLTKTERQSYALGQPTFGSKGQLTRLEYLGSATELPGFNLVWGGDWEELEFEQVSRNNTGVHLEYLSDFSDSLFLTAGLRHDDNDDFGTNTSHRLSIAYLVALRGGNTLKYRASHGSGFRAPSPYEIEYNNNSLVPPAMHVRLDRETSEGYEFGIEYLLANGNRLEAVYFAQEVEDAIYFDLEAYSGYLQDRGTSRSKGVELSADIVLGRHLDLKANYTYGETERPNGQQRIRRPEHLANIGVSYYPLNQLTLNAFLRISRDAIDEVDGRVMPLDDFAVLDLSARYRLTDKLEVYARLENALDEKYQEVIDYNSAERAAYVGFNMTFGNP